MPYVSPGGGSSGSSGGGYRGPTNGPSTTTIAKQSALQQHQVALAQALARLKADKKTSGQADALLKAYGSDIPKDVLDKYGLKVPNKGVIEGIVGRVNANPAGHALLKGLDLASRPGKEVLSITNSVRTGESFGDTARHAGDALFKGKGPSSLGEALGKKNPGGAAGVLYGAANFVGTAAADPVSYLSGGTSKVAKSALETVAKEAGEDAAKQLAREGLQSFGEDRARTILLKAAKESGQEFRDGAEAAVEKQLKQLSKSGRGGLRFGGKTIVPGYKITEPLSAAKGAVGERVGATEVGGKLLDALGGAKDALGNRFQVGYKVGEELGKGTREDYRSFLSKARAQTDILTKPTAERLETLVKDSGATKSEIHDQLGSALENMNPDTLPDHLKPLYEEVVQHANDIPALLERSPGNPLRAVLNHVHAVNQQKAWAAGLHDLAKEVDHTGLPLVSTDWRPFAKAGLKNEDRKVMTVGGERFFVRKEIADDLGHLMSPTTLNNAQKLAFRVQSIWKPYATIIRPAFNVRNAESNVLMNFLAGVRNPKYYAEAAKLQAGNGAISSYLQNVKRWAVEMGVLDSGFFIGDVAKDYSALSRTLEGGAESVAGKVGRQVLPEGAVLRTGQKVASAVEGNARLAHFIWALDQGMTKEQAARSVKKYLFDYGELTSFEQRVMKPVVAFYTYARKITPLMGAEIAKHPGVLSAQAHLRDSFNQGNEPAGQATPDWMLGSGQFFTGGPLKSILAPGTSNPVVTGLDTPLNAFFTDIEPALQAAAAIIPGKQGFEPEDTASLARAIMNIPSGGIIEGVKSLVETGTGTDLYTGGKSKDKLWMKFAKDALPVLDNVSRMKDGNKKLELVKYLLGANTYELTEARQSSATYARLLKAKAILSSKKVPTLQDLQDAGLVSGSGGGTTQNPGSYSGSKGQGSGTGYQSPNR